MNITGAPRLVGMAAHDYCAAGVNYLLREREAKYPASVAAGHITADQAANGLELMRAIVAQWQWVTDPAKPSLPDWTAATGRFGVLNHLLAADLLRVAERMRAHANRSPKQWEAGEMADLCDALAWYQQGEGGDPRIVWHILGLRMLRSVGREARAA